MVYWPILVFSQCTCMAACGDVDKTVRGWGQSCGTGTGGHGSVHRTGPIVKKKGGGGILIE